MCSIKSICIYTGPVGYKMYFNKIKLYKHGCITFFTHDPWYYYLVKSRLTQLRFTVVTIEAVSKNRLCTCMCIGTQRLHL